MQCYAFCFSNKNRVDLNPNSDCHPYYVFHSENIHFLKVYLDNTVILLGKSMPLLLSCVELS